MPKENNLVNILIILISTFLFFYLLFIGAKIVIPFIIAILFSFAIVWVSDFYKKFKIPTVIAMILSLFTYFVIFWLIGKMINSNIQDVINLLPVYQDRLSSLYISFLNYFKIPPTMDAYSLFQKVDLTTLFSSVVSSITSIFSSAGLIFFYVFFILLEYRYFWEKIKLIFLENWEESQVSSVISKIKKDIKSYFLVKTIVCFLTWIFSYLVMRAFGLDFALFWAMMIFLLKFIPSFWPTLSVSFPIILSLIQYNTIYPFIIISIWLVGIQILMWTLIEPKIMWNKLNLSPLVIIISLWFWWSLWWIIWILLSVPLMVIINIVFSKFESTRFIAILLSEKWELDVSDEIDVDFRNVKDRLWQIKNFRR